MRVSILWAGLSSFSVSFFRELANRQGYTLQLVYQPPLDEAPYGDFDLGFCEQAFADTVDTRAGLAAAIARFRPECVIVCGWIHPHYLALAAGLRREGALTICSVSNPWLGSLRQRLGVLARRRRLRDCFDAALVPGDRAARFAAELGFSEVLSGVNCADVSLFGCGIPVSDRPRSFLFVGRLVPEKGVDLLLRAYGVYRSRSLRPAELMMAGVGPMQSAVAQEAGVRHAGFLQPPQLAEAMRRAWCLVLPSRYEPWGVVLHEAAAAGLPIIASDRCGAVPQLLREGENGYVIPPAAKALEGAMARFEALTDAARDAMGVASRRIAGEWTPEIQSRGFAQELSRLLGAKARRPAAAAVRTVP